MEVIVGARRRRVGATGIVAIATLLACNLVEPREGAAPPASPGGMASTSPGGGEAGSPSLAGRAGSASRGGTAGSGVPAGGVPEGPGLGAADPRGAAGELSFPSCLAPSAPVLGMLQPGAVLAFETPDAAPIEVGLSSARDATSPERWLEEDSVALEDLGSVTVFARNADPSCEAAWFVHAYAVVPAFPGPAGTEGSTALARDTVAIVGWATEVTAVAFGAGSDNADLREPALALGPAEGTSLGALVLGEGGSAILEFASPIRDGDGADFAVFENGFSDGFLELGFVEVSTDGRTFVRFDSVYLGTKPLSAFDVHSPTLFDGLAGKYRQGFGTPFDLATLRAQPEVAIGAVDLERISYVRVVDIVGDGAATDSFGHPIYDPYPTTGTAGFDLDAVAVLHAAAR